MLSSSLTKKKKQIGIEYQTEKILCIPKSMGNWFHIDTIEKPQK